MERILRNKEIFEIIPFDNQQDVLFFPIRHHSPACSYHLQKTLDSYKPDCILIEEPQNANRLIPIVTDEETVLPIAFYYFYKDNAKLISDEGDDYKCYYPFLNSSPEYNALMYAKVQNIHAEFIDLPFGEILIHTDSALIDCNVYGARWRRAARTWRLGGFVTNKAAAVVQSFMLSAS